ncbi:hypothetical protein F511_09131 [Dorcoceras hygrometricum]|uniref:Uncharacterized protein n=1 Tax=Dorcoceras hygrometricum TaxID=472368 RepID=A0A2Z7APL6_9LAMI|nr:hypothetical protein F511_09131 [Dorcoceras hygrometricum]
MSLFDLQDVCIAIGSIATPDLPMVVDLSGIYGLKGPYSTLTTTDWFLQALSVIPRGSWDDVARRFTMIRWAALLVQPDEGVSVLVVDRIGDNLPQSTEKSRILVIPVGARHKCQQVAAAAASLAGICSGQLFEENPSALISSGLLVQADEGVSLPVVDLIDESTAAYREEPVFL